MLLLFSETVGGVCFSSSLWKQELWERVCWSCFWRTRTVLFTSACLDVHNKKHSSSDASPVDCRSNSSSYQMCQGLSLILSKRNVWETFTEDMASRRSVLLAKNNNGIFLLRISRTRKLHKRRESVWVNCKQIIETIKADGFVSIFLLLTVVAQYVIMKWKSDTTEAKTSWCHTSDLIH